MSTPKTKIELLFLCLILTGFANLISCSNDEESLNDNLFHTLLSSNKAPVAKIFVFDSDRLDVSTSEITGKAPLSIAFNSVYDGNHGIKGFAWDFGNGIPPSALKRMKRTFEYPGVYNVKLTVRDAQGRISTDTVKITLTGQDSELTDMASIAKIFVFDSERLDVSSSDITGKAPLSIAFNSVYDGNHGIKGYAWDFGKGISPSALKRMKRTFEYPGVYNVKLTVRDAQGRTATDTVKITLTSYDDERTEATRTNQISCGIGGGKADETGAKIWCWNNVSVPSGGPSNKSFSGGELVVGSECSPNQVTRQGDRLKFSLNPTTPEASSWCNNDFNMRAEIRTSPWNVDHPTGTEEWFGWSYTYGDDYIIDREIPWAFFQVHEATTGKSPLLSLWTIRDGGGGSGKAGEIHIVNATGSNNTYHPTGVVPRAGETVDIVVHVIWDDARNGLLQVWMNGNKVHDRQERTVRASNPVGGNAKFGIYKWKWRNEDGIQKSRQQGITHVETYMGPLRMITRRPGNPNYGKNSYNEVAP